ncbi:MAG: trigger factor, partial [Chitinophagaceae bacterium]
MATVTRENIGLLNDKIIVKVERDDYLPSFEKAIKNYSKQANIPGFRRGMVPVGMVKKMYGTSVFADEVIKSVEKGLSDYMTGEKLEIFAQPLPLPDNDSPQLDMNQPTEYKFAFEVGLKPAFSITELHSDHFKKYKVSVTDQMVNEELDRLQIRSGNLVEHDAVTAEDNVMNAVFAECDAEGNELEGGIRKETSLEVKYFNPFIREELQGKKPDDSIVFQISTAFEDKEREWISSDLGLDKEDPQASDKYFRFTITKVSFLEKAGMTEDFFNTVFPGKTLSTEEEFRNAIRLQIQAEW